MLRYADLDAVVVTVPNDAHVTVCSDALEAGLPVCVEKPLATRLTDGEALVECARTTGGQLFTAFHRRYNSAVLTLAQRLPPGTPIESLTVRYLERIEDHGGRDHWYLDPARCGGGCVADNGPNAYDLATLLLGDVQVTGTTIIRDVRGIDRQAQVLLRGASGVTARVELDWSYDGERKDVEVRLADGSTDSADLIRDYPDFKSSLWHEYVGVLRDFDNGRRIGVVLGFDACHFPNHYNVLIIADELRTGLDLGLELEACIRFEPAAAMSNTSRQ
ncbi:MAG: Gfo/Idh/MocA family protein [Pseudonocardiaceae bacterium]